MTKPTLPKISGPTLTCVLPVSKIKVKYRPFVVREQKALLLAQQSADMDVIYDTIKSVIATCTDNKVEFDKISVADLSYFFLQLRIASVGPEVDFVLECEDCKEPISSQLMLDKITIDTTGYSNSVKLTDTVGIVFRLPTFEDSFKTEDNADASVNVLYKLIESVYDAKQVYSKADYTEDELKDWLLDLKDKQVAAIDRYIETVPTLKHELEFNCTSCGKKHSRQLVGLQSFFRLIDAS